MFPFSLNLTVITLHTTLHCLQIKCLTGANRQIRSDRSGLNSRQKQHVEIKVKSLTC